MNAGTHEHRGFCFSSIWIELYLEVWTHERTNTQIFWWQKILELWLSWFERTNAWTQKVFEWGICQSLNAWTHERWWILMLKNLRALNFLVWARERMNTEVFGSNSFWNISIHSILTSYVQPWTHWCSNIKFWSLYTVIWKLCCNFFLKSCDYDHLALILNQQNYFQRRLRLWH